MNTATKAPKAPSPDKKRDALLAHVRDLVVDACDGMIPDAEALEVALGDDPDALLLALEACGHLDAEPGNDR